MSYVPPFTISEKVINLISDIMEMITKLTLKEVDIVNPKLRRDNRLKTIQASLAIENNSLSLDQVTAIIDGKRVLGPGQDIKEVQNAYEAYEALLAFDPYDVRALLKAHMILMSDLTKEVGRFRSGGVGEQMASLMEWANNSEVHPLIKSCVFHYEFEFIHPFADGNGRMGRMWQTLILYKWRNIFGWLPVESLIKERQKQYYDVLGACDKAADSGEFIEFMLKAIYDSLSEINATEQVSVQVSVQVSEQVSEQVKRIIVALGQETLTGNDLMARVGIKHRPTFRKNYLLPAIELGYIEMTIPEKPNSSKQMYRNPN